MNNKLQSTVSLCRRAGKLQMGFDQVKESAEAGDVKCVFVAADLSDKSKKEVCFFCGKVSVPVYCLPGNHDYDAFTLAQFQEITGHLVPPPVLPES